MKIKIVVALASLLVIVGGWTFAHTQTPMSAVGSGLAPLPTGPTGRYQLIAADVDFTTMGGKFKVTSALRIDTQTGKTWELSELDDPKTGGVSFAWVPLNETR